MRNVFSTISLKNVFYFFTASTVCLLMLVIFLGIKQYFLYRHCEQIVSSSQNLLFQFTGIKEHINETLLSQKMLNSTELIQEIKNLNGEINIVLDDILIPEEFKLAYISQVDLMNVVVSLRNMQNRTSQPSIKELSTISNQLRSINTKITGFHQQITRYTQTILLGLHRALVGMFALIISLVSIMLLVMNRYITSPILHYCRSLFPNNSANDISLFTLHSTIKHIADNQNNVKTKEKNQTTAQWPTKELSRLYRYSSIGHLLGGLSHELTNLSNGAINYTQAIIDLSDDLQMDIDSKNLLQKLFSEENKMSELLTRIIHFTSGSEKNAPVILTIDEIFKEISTLIRGSLKTDNIELSISTANSQVIVKHHARDIQLVILSALQSSRVALNRYTEISNTNIHKQIKISADQDVIKSLITFSIIDNGTPWDFEMDFSGSSQKRPWHNMNFCLHFLQTFEGNLEIQRTADELNICTIMLPYSQEKTLT